MISLDASGAPRADIRPAADALRLLLRREGPGAAMLGWLDLPAASPRDLEAIDDAAKRIRDENDLLVVAGIGGSWLGAKAAIDALLPAGGFPVRFAGCNLSPGYHARLLDELEGKRFAICVVSKSGTTTEPAIAFRLLRQALVRSVGEEAAARRIFAVTDPERGALRRMATERGWTTFAIPPGVGGRFSVLSPVGLLPIAAAGIPLAELMSGAAAALERCTRPDEKNDALRYAAVRDACRRGGAAIEVLSAFHPELATVGEWWKQLAGESEGKEGLGLFPASTVFTTDLHSLGQLLQEGTRAILETFLTARRPRRDLPIPADPDDLDGLNFLAGRLLGDVNRTAWEGTRDAHAAGGLPVLTIELDEITPAAIGGLFVFFETAIAVSATLLGVNPFDQPGVEEYKTRIFRLLGKPGYES